MSKLEELIQQYCPDEVEYKPLKSVLKIKNGKDYKHLGEGDIPVYGSGGVMTYVNTSIYDKPSVLIPRKGSIDKLYYVDTPFWNVDTVFYTEIDTSQVIEKYVFYVLQKEHLEKLNTAGGVPSLTQGVLNEVVIPVPLIPVQEEIVRILDTFTELQAELQAELQKRLQQYNYYRDNLLSFEGRTDVEWKRLGDITCIKTGSKPDAILSQKTDFEYINAGTTNSGYTASPNSEGDAITTPSRGQGGIGFVGYQRKPFWLGPLCYKITTNAESVSTRFLYHYLSCHNDIILGLKNTGGVPALNRQDLVGVIIPVPSLTEQQRIVDILDRFDSLTNDLTAGLPAEIEKRKQQYEYYRDRLLTFKRKEA